MDAPAYTNLISSVGFPIVMCLIMVKLMSRMEESHKEEIESLKEALNSNTNVLTRLETMFSMIMRKTGGDNDNERN